MTTKRKFNLYYLPENSVLYPYCECGFNDESKPDDDLEDSPVVDENGIWHCPDCDKPLTHLVCDSCNWTGQPADLCLKGDSDCCPECGSVRVIHVG